MRKDNVLIIDNFDSFTYNLADYFASHEGVRVTVCRNDDIDPAEAQRFSRIVFSPGPGLPSESTLMYELLDRFHRQIPILGVCLGHQAIAEYFGAKLLNLSTVFHGVPVKISLLENERIFKNIPDQTEVGRYHSWTVEPASVPSCLKVTAIDPAGNIMAFRHMEFPVTAVQFHPESILTPHGYRMITNWLDEK